MVSKKIKEGFVGQKMVIVPPDIINSLKEWVLTSGFYITAIGYYPKAKFHDRKRKHGCEDFILLYCLEGEGEAELLGDTYSIKPNTFTIIPANTPHHYKSSLNNPWTIYWAHYKGDEAKYLYERFKLISHEGVSEVPYSKIMINDFREAIFRTSSIYSRDSIEYSSVLLKNFLCHLLYRERNLLLETRDTIAEKARAYLTQNLHLPLTIKMISDHFNLSVSRFTELYKSETGYSPIQNLILIRIQESCQYLYFTDLSVKEIAHKVGFDDPLYFSRVFKRLMKIAPTFYRNQQKGK